jgi:hypothetical protein
VAIYRCEAKAISRGQGRSCVAAAAYRHAVELRDERQQMTHGYTKKQGVEHSEIIAPEGAPHWATDREKLWNHIDAAEKRKDAMTAREVLLALPRELNLEQQAEAVRSFVQEQFTARGIIADVAIHAPDARDGEKQPHAHIMVSDRALDASHPTGLASKKDRTLADAKGIEAMREAWGRHCNRAMGRAGLGERVDHRSLKAQRAEALSIANDNSHPEPERRLAAVRAVELDRQPEPKIGAVAAAMDRQGRGEKAHAFRDAMEVRQERKRLRELGRELRQVMERAGRTIQAGFDKVAILWQRAESAIEHQRKAFPKDIESLNKLIDSEVARRSDPIRQRAVKLYDKIKHWEDKALKELGRLEKTEPTPPTGLLKIFMMNIYSSNYDDWKADHTYITRRYWQFRRRSEKVFEYTKESREPYTTEFYKSKSEAKALKQLRKENPELVKAWEAAREERQRERAAKVRVDLERQHQQLKGRGRGRGSR